MKTIKPILIIGALVALFCNAASAQDDNPYGAGVFNGEVTTGCDYDPYTANARRTITDISLPSVAYPLEFTRTSVSRGASQDFPPGQFSTAVNGGDLYAPYTWVHSYYWRILSYDCCCSVGCTCDGAAPRRLTVLYPDGGQATFSPSNNPPGDPYWRANNGTGKGVRERLQFILDTSTTARAYCLLSDGGKVKFTGLRHGNGGTGCSTWDFTLSQIIDPFGRITTIAVQPDNSVIVTEPAGRWLRMYYKHPSIAEGNTSDWVVYQVTASDGRSVTYNYTANKPGQYYYTTLTSVNYSWDSNLTSTYTYQTNNDNANQTPLLSTAVDPLYAGPMWRIGYKYITPSTTSGQIQSENYFDGTTIGAAVTSLSAPFPRVETRADGKTRTFTYNTFAELSNYTDFLGNSAALGYGISGYTNGGLGIPTKIWDFKNNETDITFNQFTIVTTQTTFPATPEDAPAGRGTVSRSYVSDSCSTDPTHCDPNNMYPNNEYYLFSSTDEAGNTTYYKRDSNQRVVSISYPDGGSESFTYTAQFGQVQTHTLKTGDTITYQYDGRGLMQLWYDQEHSASAPNFRYGYDSLDRLNAVTDALGSGLGDPNHTTNYTYTSRNQVFVTTLPADPVDGIRHTITNNYNPVDGTLASVVDQLGHQTSYTYDNYRRTRTVTSPGHNTPETVSVFYGPTDSGDDYTYTDSKPTFIKSPTGKETAIAYDDNRRKKSVTAAYGTPDAATTSYNYDANGKLTSTVSPNEQPGQQYAGQSSSTSYDERSRAYSSTDALGHVTSKTFDAGGRLASITRQANGQVTTFDSYDSMGRVLQKTVSQSPDPAAVSKYIYYPSGLLHTFQDPHLVALGSTDSYSYVYDSLGRQQSLTYPKASPSATPTVESWHYDTAGRNDTFTNRAGIVATASYDNLNRITGVSWNDGRTPAVTYGYDVASRTTSVTNSANGATIAAIVWSYFNDGLVNTETSTYADNVARPLSYTYDADGNTATMGGLTYTYTNRNQLHTIMNGSTTVITYGYDPNGNLQTRVPNNNTSSSYSYDGLDRVIHIAHALNGTTRTFDYGYDVVGNQKWVQRDGINGDVFGYDLNDQSTSILLNVANPNTTSPGNQTVFYDAGGNRTAFQAEGLNNAYTTNPLEQYTARDSSTAAYDANGNMTTGLDGSGYTFDAQNRVLSATKAGNTDTFQYDGLGRQVSITSNGVTTYNYYDGWSLLCQWAPGATKTPIVTYIYGTGGLVEHLLDPNHVRQGQSPYCYYYQDGRGSTSHLTSSTGTLNEYYQYDLQGAPLFYNIRGTQIPASAYGIRNLFNGEQWLSEVGLYDLRHRFYSPDIGRFIQADPSGHDGGDNLYRYCSNNPLKNTDPKGLGIWNPETGFFDDDGLAAGTTWTVPGTDVTATVDESDENGSKTTLSFGVNTSSPANQVPQQYPNGYYFGNSSFNGPFYMQPVGTSAPIWINLNSSSPLASNFSTGLPVFQSPITGRTVELSARAQLKASIVSAYSGLVDLSKDPEKMQAFIFMNVGPGGPVRGVKAWAEFIDENGGIVYGLMSKDGKIIEQFGLKNEARLNLGLGGHRGARTPELIEQMKNEGVTAFTVDVSGRVRASENFAAWAPHVRVQLQEWADGFVGAPELKAPVGNVVK
jgi:RHS repeat-associated protein